MTKNVKQFNILLSGVGGQGIITLTRILAIASLTEKKDIKTSELHGLSQRGGSVETHIRFGKKIYSPLVRQGGADLIISLETQEALKACRYGSKKQTIFLINDFIKPILGAKKTPSSQEVKKEVKKFSKKVFLVPATEITKKELDKPVLAGTYLLGYGVFKKIIPLKEKSVLGAMKEVLPQKYWSLNFKAFSLAKKTNNNYLRN